MTHKKTYFALLATLLYLQSEVVTADCTADSQTQTKNFGVNLTEDALSVATDAPVGTVIYDDTIHLIPAKYSCTPNGVTIGLRANSSLVGWGPTDSSFTLGNTGLSFELFRRNGAGGSYFSVTRPQYISVNTSNMTTSSEYRIQIYKSAELSQQNLVPAGLLGTLVYSNFEFAKLYLANPITLNTASCQTPAVSVQMGDDYELKEFNRTGDTPRTVKFNIGLNQCQSGIKKVTYSLKANTQVIDQKKGIVALNSSSTAKGIGLKLMDDAGQPIALDTTYPFNGFNTTGTSFNIPLSAAYYRLADSRLEAGTANASVTFTVSYL
ncbi:fimbrial protein [Pseudomonas yamanorum]|nr:fimbrial protein [Pseudomonas yamanorum]